MQARKLFAVALAAALVGTTAVVSVSARDAFDDGERETYFDSHTIGIVGDMTGWGGDPDVPMVDVNGDGIYVGVYRNLGAGEYEFKVRADSDWADSWGMYEEEYDRTMNSQTNCKVTVTDTTDLIVMLDTNGDDEVLWPVTFYSTEELEPSIYGIVGTINGWGSEADFAMYDLDGLVYGVAKDVAAGEQMFKVRTNNDWLEDDEKGFGSWAVYEEEYERTKNSQTNIAVDLAGTSDIVVLLDTTGEDMIVWPVSYMIYGEDGSVVDAAFTGKEAAEEEESSEESTEESTEESSEESTEESTEQSELDDNYETQIKDYIFFDNSETKWDAVYAYWWDTGYGRTYDLENNDYGWEEKTDPETGEPANAPIAFPGTQMQQIPGTDVWQCRVPFGAKNIIFSSGKTDEQVAAGEIGYQTADLVFSASVNAGQIYVIDTSVEAKPGRGIEKTKYKFNAGEWKDYTGEYVSEVLNQKEIVDDSTVEESSQPSQESTNPGGTSTAPNPGTPVATGDAAMPIAVAAVAVAALGVVFFASKKKAE